MQPVGDVAIRVATNRPKVRAGPFEADSLGQDDIRPSIVEAKAGLSS